MTDAAERGQRLATRAMSPARSGVANAQAVALLLDQAGGDLAALELARARCDAAVDQDPEDHAASAAYASPAAAMRRAGGS